MHLNDYTYTLPNSSIAIHPPIIRGKSKLLVMNKQTGQILHNKYENLYKLLQPGDVVVLNRTKVIKARLFVYSASKHREFLLLELHDNKYDIHQWKILHKGTISKGENYRLGDATIKVDEVYDDGIALISSTSNMLKLCEKYGHVPLPPYLHRNSNSNDEIRYQTEFAETLGSVAAPTASLNFSGELLKKLKKKQINVVYITLHVGLGTFMPIRINDLSKHKMHSEYFEIPKNTVQTIQNAKDKNKVVAIGTTVTRTLEYANEQILSGQPKNLSGEADIFIYPGYEFRVVDAMLTNFHAPKSTVLMMAAAFAGWQNLNHAYGIALADNYKFLSYGDSMLII